MGVRPCTRADAPALAALHGRALLDGAPATPGIARFVKAFYADVLFDNPWAAPDLPSLVFEGADGAIAAFVGVLPRPMSLRGRPVRAALITRVMADPAHPEGAIGVAALFRQALRGPQDVSLADLVNEPGRRLWEASKGVLVTAGSLWWSSPPGPAPAPPSTGRPIGAAELLDAVESTAKGFALRPVYDEHSLGWLLAHLRAAGHRGRLHARAVDAPDGTRAGWYLAYANDAGFNGVQQVGVHRGGADLVLADLLAHLPAAGGAALTRGRVDLGLAAALEARGCALRLGPWTYAHSRDPEILLALTAGQAFLTRLEGEY